MKIVKKSVLKFDLILVLSLFTIISCNNSQKGEMQTLQNDKENLDVYKFSENYLSYDGTKFQNGKLSELIKDSYVVDIFFRPFTDYANNKFDWNDTTPPMFGYIWPYVFIQTESNQIKIDVKDDIDFYFRVLKRKWYRIQVISLKDENLTKILVNDKEMFSVDKFIQLERNYIIGKGYQQRYWKGDVGFIRVYDYSQLNKFPRMYILNIEKDSII